MESPKSTDTESPPELVQDYKRWIATVITGHGERIVVPVKAATPTGARLRAMAGARSLGLIVDTDTVLTVNLTRVAK